MGTPFRALHLLALVLASAVSRPAPGQDASWLDRHAARLMSIDPDYPDGKDLDPILDAIGDRRIVVLAERTPGDGAALWAKTRLSRHLIRERGFTVVAFEAGLYDARAMNAQFAAGTDYGACAPIGLPEQWAGSGYMLALYRDVWTSYFSKRPVEVCGFDRRITGRRTNRQLPRELLDYLGSIDPHPLDKEQRRHNLTVLERLHASAEADDDAGVVAAWEALHRLLGTLDANEGALVEAKGRLEFSTWRRIIEDQVANAEDAMGFVGQREVLADDNARQARMADHLAWLARDVYPERKLIVWCSSLTAMADAAGVQLEPDPGLIADFEPAGERWRAAFGDQIYVIAFDAGAGENGPIRGDPLPAPTTGPGSFEAELDSFDSPFLFFPLDRQGPAWMTTPRPGNLLGLNPALAALDRLPGPQRVSAAWAHQFDAVVFIRTAFPNHWEAKPPDGAVHTVHLE